MRKILGITVGGLRDKLVRLVVVTLIIAVAAFAGITIYQNQRLAKIVDDARVEQQGAITQSTQSTMNSVLAGSLAEAAQLRAKIADNDFAEVIKNVKTLQTMAQGLLVNRAQLAPAEVSLPDASLDGTVSAMVLCDEGVDYTQSEYLGAVAHMSSSMVAMCSNSDKIESCYIGLSDGTDLVADANSGAKLDADGKPIPFPVTKRPWYQGAAKNGRIYFTELMKDAFTGQLMITCSAPIYADGKVAGVAGIDIVLENMNDFVLDAAGSGAYIYIINNLGHVVLTSDSEVNLGDESQSYDLRRSENETLSAVITQSYRETTPLTEVSLSGESYYLVGSPLPNIGWALAVLVDKAVTELPGKQLLGQFDEIQGKASQDFASGTVRTNQTALMIIAALFLLGTAAAVYRAKRIVTPVETMTKDIVSRSRAGEFFEMKDSYKTGDEIELLAQAFGDLSERTQHYIEDLTQITREKERVSTELHMATQIQESMLPSIFPAFPDRPEFDIYASMYPAREVGGDFYDFFLVDDDHLCMVMADVSGKGVPAALFMMASKIILANNAMMGKSPAKILEDTNKAICANNRMEMFVTVWLGILEISTGKLVCSNAGHEYPAIRHADGKYELFKDKHGFVVGGMDGVRYQDYELTLQPGACIFVYTDGVPEAKDKNSELFGTKRMLQALNQDPGAAPEAVMDEVNRAVNSFVQDEEQFDDLTMLCLTYHGPAAEQ